MENLEADDAFRFMGDQKEACKRKVICHIHESLVKAPDWVQMIFRFFRCVNIKKYLHLELIPTHNVAATFWECQSTKKTYSKDLPEAVAKDIERDADCRLDKSS